MSIISRYIAKKFWGPFLFILCIFSLLVFLGDSVEKIRWVNSYGTSLRMVLKYSLFTLPAWVVQLLPVACLLSGLLVITDMISTGEWTACLAGGLTVRQIFKPLLFCIAFVALCGFCVQEFVVPDFSKRAELTFQRRIKGDKNWYFNVQNDVTLRLDDKRILFAKQVKADAGIMEGMFIDIYGDDLSLIKQIQAKRFVWDANQGVWFFEDGIIRNFGKEAKVTEETFDKLISDYAVKPSEIALGKTDADFLSIREIIRRINFLNKSGLKSTQEHTFLQSKLAAPFVTIIVCLLGMPLAIALKRSSKLLNIISAIAIGFGFWWIVSVLSSAGQSGMLPAWLAAWGPVAFFAIVIYFEFKKLRI